MPVGEGMGMLYTPVIGLDVKSQRNYDMLDLIRT